MSFRICPDLTTTSMKVLCTERTSFLSPPCAAPAAPEEEPVSAAAAAAASSSFFSFSSSPPSFSYPSPSFLSLSS